MFAPWKGASKRDMNPAPAPFQGAIIFPFTGGGGPWPYPRL